MTTLSNRYVTLVASDNGKVPDQNKITVDLTIEVVRGEPESRIAAADEQAASHHAKGRHATTWLCRSDPASIAAKVSWLRAETARDYRTLRGGFEADVNVTMAGGITVDDWTV